eukprot:m.65998 g.65998  ORF g.65998 m.65998 type:complete len:604 (-) comp8329_c0_seq1:177-1988(-)
MAPSWMHGGIPREQAEELVGTEDGTFLVRQRLKKGGVTADGEYILSVVFKGKPTHHAIKANDDGILCINGKPHGKTNDIEKLVGFLDRKRPGWPVALDKPVAATTSSNDTDANATPAAAGGNTSTPTADKGNQPSSTDTNNANHTPANQAPATTDTTTTTTAASADNAADAHTTTNNNDKAQANDSRKRTDKKAATNDHTVADSASSSQPPAPSSSTRAQQPTHSTAPSAESEAVSALDQAAASAAQRTAAREAIEKQQEDAKASNPNAPPSPEPDVTHRRRRLSSLGISKEFQAPSPEVERKPGVPWGQGDLKRQGGGSEIASVNASTLSAPPPASRQGDSSTMSTGGRAPLGLVARRAAEAPDSWDRSNVPQHKIRVYEVLRALFSEAKEANPKKLLLSREDLATRFSLAEITPVLKGIGAFDPDTGSFALHDVFAQSDPAEDGTVSLANFLKSCDPDQAARARAKAEAERRRLQEEQEKALAAEAARQAAEIEAERRANERMLVEAKMAQLRQQQETQEKLYQEHLARLEDMQRAERERIRAEAEALRIQQEEDRKRAQEEKARRLRERREAWKSRQLPFPWEVAAAAKAAALDNSAVGC